MTTEDQSQIKHDSIDQQFAKADSNQLTLLPHTFRNDLFSQNIDYFQKHQPALFTAIDNHKCAEYRLCAQADRTPNIVHMPTKQPVYKVSSMQEIISPIRKEIDQLFCFTHLDTGHLGGADDAWKKSNPIQLKLLNALYDIGPYNFLHITAVDTSSLNNYCTDYLPLVRVYGIGLGFHITELIKQKKISFMLIYEPNFDLFYTSLYTIPWFLVFKYFEVNNKGINLALGTTPEQTEDSHLSFIEQRLTPLTSLFYRYNHYTNSPHIQALIQNEKQSESVHRKQMDSGWYEDQRTGLYFAARNIKNSNPFFTGRSIKRFFRVFIVGSGPSLNEAIDYIKNHRNDAIIIACGSAIDPLLTAGIIPDFEVIQERKWHLMEHEKKHDPNTLKQIRLFKLNVVSTKVDACYKSAMVFQKFRDPGSTLMEADYAVTSEVNPTVTNAGISMAAVLGVNEAYLFGVDYGAPENTERMHADNTIYDHEKGDSVKEHGQYSLPGNWGTTIKTNAILSWSLDSTVLRLKRHQNIKWYNVGEGALINGTQPLSINKLPQNFAKKIQKERLLDEISKCFDHKYDPANVFEKLHNYYMKQIENYLEAILDFLKAKPCTREEVVSTLTLMYKAVNVGDHDKHFLPASLLSRGFKQFITNVYIQTSLLKDDTSAEKFFAESLRVLADHIDDIKDDLKLILSAIDTDEELELKK
jgi:hypothetical protein